MCPVLFPLLLSPRGGDHFCLYCLHFTVNDLGFCLLSVCCKVTGPLSLYPSPLFLSLPTVSTFFCFTPDLSFSKTYHLSPFLFCFSLSLCLCVYVSPVLTPPESEKADSEDRVSLKVCSQHSFLPSAYISL